MLQLQAEALPVMPARKTCNTIVRACMLQVQAAAAGALGALGLAAGAIGFYGVAPAQLLTVTSAFSVFMVCSAAGTHPCCSSSTS